jgi:hypothetical protein
MTAAHRVVPTAAVALIGLNALFLIGNGLFMLVAPAQWYYLVPGVKETGSFNQHFIRDIGIIQIFLGAAFAIGAIRPSLRDALWGAATLWLLAHALFHFWEVAVGICAPSALVRDFPAVTLPALIGVVMTAWAWLTGRRTHGSFDQRRARPHAAPAVQELRDAR